MGQLWLRGRASVLLWEYHWFGNLGQDTEPQTAPDVLAGTLHGLQRMNACMIPLVALDKRVGLNAPNVKCK